MIGDFLGSKWMRIDALWKGDVEVRMSEERWRDTNRNQEVDALTIIFEWTFGGGWVQKKGQDSEEFTIDPRGLELRDSELQRAGDRNWEFLTNMRRRWDQRVRVFLIMPFTWSRARQVACFTVCRGPSRPRMRVDAGAMASHAFPGFCRQIGPVIMKVGRAV
jgi:hypothetical protein